MRCPYCNQDNTRVVDSRPVEENNSIRRRRMCDACGKRFTTYEKVETIPLIVIKKDQHREQCERSKEREISSTRIGEIVMEELKNLDAVAYVRFASVYREFKDVNTFMEELSKLLEGKQE